MKLAVLKETAPGETRVAATPESVKKLIALGHKVKLETQAGTVAGFTDDAYKAEGAEIIASGAEAQIDADLILRVAGPTPEEAKSLPENAALIALFDPFNASETLAAANSRNATCLAMEFTPRITRAQSMDALSSQSNLAGYRAVMEGAIIYGRAMPMMMTAAGTVAPAKVFITVSYTHLTLPTIYSV